MPDPPRPVVITNNASAVSEAGYAGFLERAEPFVLTGWVANSKGEAQPIEIVLGGRVLGSLVPTLSRPDLAPAIGDGVAAGFFVDICELLSRGGGQDALCAPGCNGKVALSVRLYGREEHLAPSPIEWDRDELQRAVERLATTPVQPNLAPDVTFGTFGCVERIDEQGVAGWALSVDHPSSPLRVCLELDGVTVATTSAHLLRHDVAAIVGSEARCGFLLTWTEDAWKVLSALDDETSLRTTVRLERSGRQLRCLVDDAVAGAVVRRWLAPATSGLPVALPTVAPSHVQHAVSGHFDAAYYQQVHDDVATAGIDALQHYLSTGWREGRNPSASFDTNYYLATVSEAEQAGICPLTHYVERGRREGRLPQSLTRRHLSLLSARRGRMPQQEPALTHPGPPLSVQAIVDALQSATEWADGKLVVAFSHDVYRENTGGIQILLCHEERRFNERGVAYVGVAPARPRLSLWDAATCSPYEVVVTVDGCVLGRTPFEHFAHALEVVGADAERSIRLVVHSLLGHAPQRIEALWASLRSSKTAYFWVHDYTALCPSFSLMRNDAIYCHAPPRTSPGCTICVHGSARRAHVEAIEKLLRAIPFHIVAPSESAQRVLERGTSVARERCVVHPHARLTPAADGGPRKRLRGAGVVRVAYCGYPMIHKGWQLLLMLLDAFSDDERFEFHHFGAEDSGDPRLKHHEVRVSADDPGAMSRALEDAEIDVVLVLSVWPETFCFVAYEAVAAGCSLATLEGSGNAQSLAQTSGRGAVFQSPEDLARAFADDRIIELAARPPRRYRMEIIGTTATLHEDER